LLLLTNIKSFSHCSYCFRR